MYCQEKQHDLPGLLLPSSLPQYILEIVDCGRVRHKAYKDQKMRNEIIARQRPRRLTRKSTGRYVNIPQKKAAYEIYP